ncbi:hypothetical protein NC651_013010 [Populus alba x Populus x berolinensis]|nr:hypothetical protein NC651_013010 [Populus alba x Populus x berolinensis]
MNSEYHHFIGGGCQNNKLSPGNQIALAPELAISNQLIELWSKWIELLIPLSSTQDPLGALSAEQVAPRQKYVKSLQNLGLKRFFNRW